MSDGFSRHVLVVVEDQALGEMLLDALAAAGHTGELLAEGVDVRVALRHGQFDAAIIDVDTRARNGNELVKAVRETSPGTTVITLLPCGAGSAGGPADLAVEKPARLQALLSLLSVGQPLPRN